MKGKILNIGIINGDDGKQYKFILNDIQNLDGRNEQSIIGSQIDFTPDENENASKIFIIEPDKSLAEITNITLSDDVKSIKTKAYISIAFRILAITPVIGLLLGIISIISMILALKDITRITKIPLLSKFVICVVLYLIAILILAMGMAAGYIRNIGFMVFFIFVFCAIAFYVMYLFYKNLSYATNENMFMYVFYASVVSEALLLTVVLSQLGIILIIISFILELIAWIKFKELRIKSE